MGFLATPLNPGADLSALHCRRLGFSCTSRPQSGTGICRRVLNHRIATQAERGPPSRLSPRADLPSSGRPCSHSDGDTLETRQEAETMQHDSWVWRWIGLAAALPLAVALALAPIGLLSAGTPQAIGVVNFAVRPSVPPISGLFPGRFAADDTTA